MVLATLRAAHTADPLADFNVEYELKIEEEELELLDLQIYRYLDVSTEYRQDGSSVADRA